VRSRWLADLAPAAAGAGVEGVWTGALAALVTGRSGGGSGAAFVAGAAGGVFCGALVTRLARSGVEPGRRARLAAVALTLAIAAAFFAAGRGWSADRPLIPALGALVLAALLVYLGISLGREDISPDAALRRAVRAFVLLCGLLVLAALASSTPAWAAGAVVAALVAGAVSVATARAQSLSAVTPRADRATTWRWLLAVAGVLLLVVAVAALLSLVLRVDVILWALAVAGEVLQYLLRLLGFGLGWAGAGLLRAFAWVLDLFHVHGLPKVEAPKSDAAHLQVLPKSPKTGVWGTTRVILTAVAIVAAVTVPLLLVALALRRVRATAPGDIQEERETVLTLRAASGDAAARLRRRLARLVPRRSPPATPAELVRREYEGLERRLTRAGHPRPAAMTVRVYLQSLPGGPEARAVPEAALAADVPEAARPSESAGERGAADLAGLYELARYSAHVVDREAAQRFRDLAQAFRRAQPASR
jgi:MFS family permease